MRVRHNLEVTVPAESDEASDNSFPSLMEQSLSGKQPPSTRSPFHKWGQQLYTIADQFILIRWHYYGLDIVLNVLCVMGAFELALILRLSDEPIRWAELVTLSIPNVFIGFLYAGVAYLMALHRRLWRYAGVRDGLALGQSILITAMIVSLIDLFNVMGNRLVPLSVVVGGSLLSFLFLGSVKMLPRVMRASLPVWSQSSTTRVMIVGAGQAGADLAARFLLNATSGYRVIAFVDDDPAKRRGRIHGKPIMGKIKDIPDLVLKFGIDLIAIALPTVKAERMSEIVSICQQTQARIKIMQGLDEVAGHPSHSLVLREVNVADLLGRPIVPLHTDAARAVLEGKTVLVTGAAGSIGSELCRQVLAYNPACLLALDTNETGLFELAEDLRTHPNADSVDLAICDITDTVALEHFLAARRPHIVFHAAAYKHVPLLEMHPEQAVRTNVTGTWNLCQAALRHQAERFIFVSTDKAAEPVSVLGVSKRAGELMIQTLSQTHQAITTFCAVRFGNVIGSRGSVVPSFMKQIEQGGPVTVTDPDVTRYFMTIPEACGLVIHTATIAETGELFLLDMGRPVRIVELAEKMIRLRGMRIGHDISITYTGLRPGERLHEILAAHNERLLPTANDKIFHVAQDEDALSLQAMEQWLQELQQTLSTDNTTLLRHLLFQITQEPVTALQAAGSPAQVDPSSLSVL